MLGELVLALLSVVNFGLGVLILLNAKGAVHEIEAGICWIISSIFFVGAAIVAELRAHRPKGAR
jgi:hypothetical protein